MLEQIQELANNPDVVWVLHNSLYDLDALESVGINVDYRLIHHHDTLLMAHAWNNLEDHGLKKLARKYLGIKRTDEQLVEAETVRLRRVVSQARRLVARKLKRSKVVRAWLTDRGLDGPGKLFGQSPVAEWVSRLAALPITDGDVKNDLWLPYLMGNGEVEQYAGQDAVRTLALFYFYEQVLKEQNLWDGYLSRLEAKSALWDMQRVRVHLDKSTLEAKRAHCNFEITEATAELRRLACDSTFNPASNEDCARLLYGRQGYSTSKLALRGLVGPAARTLEDYRRADSERRYLAQYVKTSIRR
jgi:hypothetical protein